MSLTRRHNAASATDGAAAGAAPSSAPNRIAARRAPAGANAPAAGAAASPSATDDVYEYKPHSPKLLLGAFLVFFCMAAWSGWMFFSIRRTGLAAEALQRAVDSVQPLRARQEELNRRTHMKWDLYAEQRGNVTSALNDVLRRSQQQGVDAPELCVLGAGNLNDLALGSLLAPSSSSSGVEGGFSRLALVDLDLSAMREGIERQVLHRGFDAVLAKDSSRIALFAADVTGSFERPLSEWKRNKVRHDALLASGTLAKDDAAALFPPLDEVDAWIATLQQQSRPDQLKRYKGLPSTEADTGVAAAETEVEVEVEGGSEVDTAVEAGLAADEKQLDTAAAAASATVPRVQYDVVASVCLLSQLLDMYMSVVPESHPRFLAGVLALRDAHLALLLELLRPGGWGLLVTDVVASTTAPELRTTPHEELGALLPRLVAQSNFFTGCNPRAIEARLQSAHFAPFIAPHSVALQPQPWSWRIGGNEDKRFLVYAITFQKRA